MAQRLHPVRCVVWLVEYKLYKKTPSRRRFTIPIMNSILILRKWNTKARFYSLAGGHKSSSQHGPVSPRRGAHWNYSPPLARPLAHWLDRGQLWAIAMVQKQIGRAHV